MWWHAVPSGALVAGFYSGCSIIAYTTNLLFLKTPYKRKMESDKDVFNFLRDSRISGTNNPYNQIGLGNLSLGLEK